MRLLLYFRDVIFGEMKNICRGQRVQVVLSFSGDLKEAY